MNENKIDYNFSLNTTKANSPVSMERGPCHLCTVWWPKTKDSEGTYTHGECLMQKCITRGDQLCNSPWYPK